MSEETYALDMEPTEPIPKTSVSRRLFLRRLGTAIVAVSAGSLVSSCSTKGPDVKSEFRDESRVLFEGVWEEAQRKTITDAVNEWHQQYTCNRVIKISHLPRHKSKQLGKNMTLLETATPGEILIGDEGDMRNIVLHAMTHACKADKPTRLAAPIPFVDGKIIGYHGANIVVKIGSGEPTKFTKIEEGMAERAASVFPNYTVTDPRYHAVGQLALTQFPLDRYPTLHNRVKKNDVPALARVRFGLSADTAVSASHLEAMMSEYQSAWDLA